MHFIKSSTYPDITFETLFPRNLRSKLNWTQTDFLKLLPKEFLALEDGNSIPLHQKQEYPNIGMLQILIHTQMPNV